MRGGRGADHRRGARSLSVVHDGHFRVETTAAIFEAEAVVVATGGLSIPKMGATDFGYGVAEQFGLRVVDLADPALVPLVFSAGDRDRWCELSGVSTEVVAIAGTEKEARQFPRKDAGHTSGAERPSDLAGVFLLGAR